MILLTHMLELLTDDLGEIEGRPIAVLGGTPALAQRLCDCGARLRIYADMAVDRRAIAAFSAETAVVRTDAAILAGPVDPGLDWPHLAKLMRRPLLLDGCGVLAGLALPPWVVVRQVQLTSTHRAILTPPPLPPAGEGLSSL